MPDNQKNIKKSDGPMKKIQGNFKGTKEQLQQLEKGAIFIIDTISLDELYELPKKCGRPCDEAGLLLAKSKTESKEFLCIKMASKNKENSANSGASISLPKVEGYTFKFLAHTHPDLSKVKEGKTELIKDDGTELIKDIKKAGDQYEIVRNHKGKTLIYNIDGCLNDRDKGPDRFFKDTLDSKQDNLTKAIENNSKSDDTLKKQESKFVEDHQKIVSDRQSIHDKLKTDPLTVETISEYLDSIARLTSELNDMVIIEKKDPEIEKTDPVGDNGYSSYSGDSYCLFGNSDSNTKMIFSSSDSSSDESDNSGRNDEVIKIITKRD